jgi:hypothetical protein
MAAQVLLFGRAAPQPGPAGFVDFWAAYPRRVARLAAQRAWDRLSVTDRAAAMAAVPAHAEYWRAAGREAERIPHPASWLNGRRWEDELPGVQGNAADREARARRIAEGL